MDVHDTLHQHSGLLRLARPQESYGLQSLGGNNTIIIIIMILQHRCTKKEVSVEMKQRLVDCAEGVSISSNDDDADYADAL